MGSSSAPPPPDYAAAAEATAAGDLESARYNTLANRPDIYTPEGSRVWETSPVTTFDQSAFDKAMIDYESQQAAYDEYQPSQDTDRNIWNHIGSGAAPTAPVLPNREDFTTTTDQDKWTGTVNLNPEAQKAFEANQRMQTGLANLGESSVAQVQDLFSRPFNIEGGPTAYQGQDAPLPEYGQHRQQVMDAMLSRVNTDIGRDRERTRSRLIAQGIPEGSEAFNRQMENLDRKQTDARQQAELSAENMAGMGYQSALAGRGMGNQENMADFTTGLDTRRQGIQEALLNRQTPLNEMGAFRTGSQVNMPAFQPYGNQAFTGGPDYTGAANAQGQYDIASSNQDIAQQNALMGGLFSLGSAGIGTF